MNNFLRRLGGVAMGATTMLGAFGPITASSVRASDLTKEDNFANVVYIECGSKYDGKFVAEWSGSGVVLSEDWIITNAHVVLDENGNYAQCQGGYSDTSYLAPEITFTLESTGIARYNEYFDYAIMEAHDLMGNKYSFTSSADWANSDSMTLSEEVYVLGYPGVGGSTITLTEGKIAGFLGTNWIKTDAAVAHGNSGGGAFDRLGNFFGIPTWGGEGIGQLQSVNAILEDAFGADTAVRDYDTLYTSGNHFCFFDNCYNFAEDEQDYPEIFEADSEELVDDSWEDSVDDLSSDDYSEDDIVEEFIEAETSAYDETQKDQSLQTRMLGRILLQVNQHGEAWYVNPKDGLRYYMQNGDVAYEMMRHFSLGITTADLETIPSVSDYTAMNSADSVCASNALANRLRGNILLQVESHGEAWYIHPDKCLRIYLQDGAAAYTIMRYLSLGIGDSDLKKLPSGQLSVE